MMTINALVNEAHENAKSKGWWTTEKSPLEVHMLIVSEIAEATEEVRAKRDHIYHENLGDEFYTTDVECIADKKLKPEGEIIELADAMIRIFDYCGHKKWDLEAAIRLKMDYNATRSHRHGGKAY